ncbi:MAG: hypothetical protein EBU90_02290 [Proteobacteria bacterium]|nr:hypothetical protein [Pseudomonadota bacterium]NBP13064.1 hypothetical protein [bacterium]
MTSTVDKLLEQLELLNQNYLWIIKEGEKILSQINKAMDVGDMNAVNVLRDKFIELENRHNRDRITYNKIIGDSREYFRKKYGIDLFKYFELEDI